MGKQEDIAKKYEILKEFTLKDVIDRVIEANGITGVGLISLADSVHKYILKWTKQRSTYAIRE